MALGTRKRSWDGRQVWKPHKEHTMSTNNSQDPETKAEGELSEEQESEVSAGSVPRAAALARAR